ncbi:MAG TPA: hypothetical protein PKE23_05025, partial [Anaerolineales bacterium]|nr:hypothetical protein [Anaerolineales bacterium]
MSTEKLHIDPYERNWMIISAILLVLFATAVSVAAFGLGIQVPAPEQRVDPKTVATDPNSPWSNPGLREIAPGKYDARSRPVTPTSRSASSPSSTSTAKRMTSRRFSPSTRRGRKASTAASCGSAFLSPSSPCSWRTDMARRPVASSMRSRRWLRTHGPVRRSGSGVAAASGGSS